MIPYYLHARTLRENLRVAVFAVCRLNPADKMTDVMVTSSKRKEKEGDMPNLETCFPSRYAKAGHLKGNTVFTIKSAALEEVDFDGKTERKLVVAFTTPVHEDGPQRLICNKTNAQAIAKATGSRNTDDWVGKPVELYTTTVNAFGEDHEVIRILDRAPITGTQTEAVPF